MAPSIILIIKKNANRINSPNRYPYPYSVNLERSLKIISKILKIRRTDIIVEIQNKNLFMFENAPQ